MLLLLAHRKWKAKIVGKSHVGEWKLTLGAYPSTERSERASERAYKRTNYQCSFQHSHIIIINVIVIPTIGTIHANNSHPLTLSNRMHSFDVGVLLWQYFCSKGRYKGFSVVYFQYYAMRIGQYLNNIYWIWHSVLSDFHHYIIGLRAFTQINK